MKSKYISVLSFVLLNATAGYAQSSNVTLNLTPSRSVGTAQLLIGSTSPNLVEGRELYNPRGIALDTSVTPPILYVSDFSNNRVLAWKDASSLTNGKKADLAVGQPDLTTTLAAGPGTSFTTGLNHPMGIAVYNGDLYVADGGNNRVLRYPRPFQQTGLYPIPDLYIGQTNLNGRGTNYPSGTANAQGIYLSSGITIYDTSIAFDHDGNLWMTDPGNRRVLRFKKPDLDAGGGALAADLELGQLDLNSTQTAININNANSLYLLNQFDIPSVVAFDPNGNLFVSDSDGTNPAAFSRILVFVPPFSTGQSAARQMGVFPQGYKLPTSPTDAQAVLDKVLMSDPEGIFFTGSGQVGVIDSRSSRIMVFDPYTNWPTDNTPPLAKAIIGQPNLCVAVYPTSACRAVNNGNPLPSPATFNTPIAVAYAGSALFVADSGNNRVVVLPQNGDGSFGNAATVLGQDRFNTNSINLIEGREFQFLLPTSGAADAAIAIDASGSTPHLYVSDPYNNRVLGFNDLRRVGPGSRADIVLGQPDMQTALCNPSGDATRPTLNSLCRPIGLLVDSSGNLYVADSGNGRVLRFPAPFGYQGSLPEPADLVLGQANFNIKITDPSNNTMALPYGLAFSGVNGLVVSDQFDNRVLYFEFPSEGTFVGGRDNGKAATKVFGQATFLGIKSGSDDASLNNPHHVAADSEGRIYVADSGNNRIIIFPDPHPSTTPSAGARASLQIPGLNSPQGVFVNKLTGEIWAANTNGSQSVRWANYQAVQFGNSATAVIPDCRTAGCPSGDLAFAILALATDQYGDLFVADSANRVAFFYQGLQARNAASLLPSTDWTQGSVRIPGRPLAPGMAATICPPGVVTCDPATPAQFGTQTTSFTDIPNLTSLPTTMGDIQVILNGTPAPLYYVSPGQINFYVSMNAPTTGTADVQVVQASTGQVLGAASVPMNVVSPAVFMVTYTGALRQPAVLNQDNTLNSPTNPAARGSYISIYATGQGYVPGAPPDGFPSTGLVPTVGRLPEVFISGCFVDDSNCTHETGEHIQYSGLAPAAVGLWQINVLVPMNTGVGNQVPFAVVLNGVNNYDPAVFKTVLAIK